MLSDEDDFGDFNDSDADSSESQESGLLAETSGARSVVARLARRVSSSELLVPCGRAEAEPVKEASAPSSLMDNSIGSASSEPKEVDHVMQVLLGISEMTSTEGPEQPRPSKQTAELVGTLRELVECVPGGRSSASVGSRARCQRMRSSPSIGALNHATGSMGDDIRRSCSDPFNDLRRRRSYDNEAEQQSEAADSQCSYAEPNTRTSSMSSKSPKSFTPAPAEAGRETVDPDIPATVPHPFSAEPSFSSTTPTGCATTSTAGNEHDVPRTSAGNAPGDDEHADQSAPSVNTENPTILRGVLWKKRSNLSRATKVFRLLRREAKALLSQGEDWFAGHGSLQIDRVGLLAREVMALIGGSRSRPPSLETGESPPASTETAGEVSSSVCESWWRSSHVCLLSDGSLQWTRSREHSHHDSDKPLDPWPAADSLKFGPLRGSTVEHLGIERKPRAGGPASPKEATRDVLYIFSIFPPHNLRRQPLTFAAETMEEAEKWIAALREATLYPRIAAPPKRSFQERAVEFWEAKGPPPGLEPPPAVLHLEVIQTSGLVGPGGRPAGTSTAADRAGASLPGPPAGRHNLYVLGKVHSSHFRTATRYAVPCSGVTKFGHTFAIPLVFENPDELIHFEVFHEPEFQDSEPALLGSISIPLFACRRGRRIRLRVPLRQDDATRLGFVNVSFGHLTIAVFLEQPAGHLFLPVEPCLFGNDAKGPVQEEKTLNWSDLEKQISRIDALIQLIFVRWMMNIVYVLQWEEFRVSFAWLSFLMLWFLAFWQWSFSIIVAILLKRTIDLHPSRQRKLQSQPAQVIEQLPPGVGQGIQRPARAFSVDATTPEAGASPGHTADLVIWESERRIVFGGFHTDYLVEGLDEPPYVNEFGRPCAPPDAIVWINFRRYRYQWTVVVNAETDENGWQYAFAFTQEAQWRHSLDTVHTWVRRRQHHGRFVSVVEDDEPFKFHTEPGENSPSGACGTGLSSDGGIPNEEPPVESMLTENDQLNKFVGIYLMIRNDVDFILSMLEKHKNLVTWADESVSHIVAWVLAVVFALSLVTPTRLVFVLIIALAFYIGSAMGQRKREHRRVVLDALSKWSSSVCGRQQCFKGNELYATLEDAGVTRLGLRDWCNSTYKTRFNLKSFDICINLAELADLIVQSSPKIEKTVRRYRAWHSDFYNNFIDHVPSDTAEHETRCICYKLPGASMPEISED